MRGGGKDITKFSVEGKSEILIHFIEDWSESKRFPVNRELYSCQTDTR